MIYGYARVSTAAQDLAAQLDQLRAAGCEKIFHEKYTAEDGDQLRQRKKLLRALAPGDLVITPAVDRISRDTTDLLVLARDIQRAGAGLKSLAEPIVDTTSDFVELVLAALGIAAKLERRRIIARTTEGRARAKANGVRMGRKPKLTPAQKQEAQQRRDNGATLKTLARSYNVGKSTIDRATKASSPAGAA